MNNRIETLHTAIGIHQSCLSGQRRLLTNRCE